MLGRVKKACVLVALSAAFASPARASADSPAVDATQLPALWAVVVGVSDYKFLPPAGTAGALRTDLNFAARDAEAFADFLRRQSEMGAYRDVFVRLFADSQATKEEVVTAIEDGLVDARNDDLVIIYFAGHGVPDAAGAEYLLLWDSREDRLSATAYRMNDLWTRLKDRIRAERAVVILDACHAGALGNARGSGTNAASSFQRYLADARGRALLAATREGQSAYEDESSRHGYFTRMLLEGLEKGSPYAAADFNRDGVVLVNEAFDYVYDRVKSVTDGKQLPDIKGDVSGLLPIAVTTARERPAPQTTSSPAIVVTTSPVRARVFVQGPDGAMEDMGLAPVLRRVDPGRYTVVALADGFADAEKTVEVSEREVPVRLTLSPRAASSPARSGRTLDFEGVASGDRADTYLRDRGVTIERITGGTALYILSDQAIYEGAACKASSGENLLTQNGSNDPVSFTLKFDRPCTSVSFTRPKLLTGPNGITHPEWDARAYDREGHEVDAVSEELIRSFIDVPAARFTLKGGAIASVTFSSMNRHFAAFSAVLVDDLTLSVQ